MAIVIDVKEAGLSEAMKHLDQFEEALRRVEAAMKGLGGASMGAGTSASRAARSAQNSSAGHPSATGVRSPAAQQPKAKAYNNYRYWDAMNRASGGRYATQRGGSAAAAFAEAQLAAQAGDARALARMGPLSRALAKGQGGSSGLGSNNLNTAGMATGNMGVMAMSSLSRLGPIGGMIAAMVGAGLAIGHFAETVLAANNKIANSAAFGYENGSSIFNSGLAKRLTKSGGMNLDAVFAAVMQGGPARGLIANMGVDVTGGPYGNLDKAQVGKAAAKLIMGQQSEADAIRMANMFNNPSAAKLWYLDKDNRDYVLNGDGNEFGFDEKRRAINAQVRWERTVEKLEKLIDRFLSSKFLDMIAPDTSNPDYWRKQLGHPIAGPHAARQLKELEEKARKAKDNAMEQNTMAVNENTRALKAFREVFGGGIRVQKAIPKKLDGLVLNNDTYRAALASGVI